MTDETEEPRTPDISESALENPLDFHLNGNLGQYSEKNWKTRLAEYEAYRFDGGRSQAEGLLWLFESKTPENEVDTYGVVLELLRRHRILPRHVLTNTIQGIEGLLARKEQETHFLSASMREQALREDIQTLKWALER